MIEGKLTSPSYLREIMETRGLRFNRRLGQHFLVDENILGKILKAAEIEKSDVVLEVGAGAGTLTVELARRARRVVAVEIDRGLVGLLKELLQPYENVVLIHADALKLDVRGLFPDPGKRKVVANIPYSITSPLVMKLLALRDGSGPFFERLLLMVQEEVAGRLTASAGGKDYGVLSVMAAFYSEVSFLRVVLKTAFHPVPKVDSALVLLKPRRLLPGDPETFRRVVSAAFAQRRKTVLNSLKHNLDLPPATVEVAMAAAGLDRRSRAEQLQMDDFVRLAEILRAQLASNDS